MKLENLQLLLEEKVEEIITIINENIPQKGDKCCDCQKMTMLQSLNNFSYTVNGLEKGDLE